MHILHIVGCKDIIVYASFSLQRIFDVHESHESPLENNAKQIIILCASTKD